MILQAAPVFSLTKELLVFTAFVVLIIVGVIIVEVHHAHAVKKIEEDRKTQLRIRKEDEAFASDLFDKVEEYQDDFDGYRKSS